MAHQLCVKQLPPQKKEYEMSPAVNNILGLVKTLSTSEYHSLCSELAKTSPCSTEQLKKVMNLYRDQIAKEKKAEQNAKVEGSTPRSGTTGIMVCGRQRNDNPGAIGSASSSGSVPATKVSIIIRGDLIANQHRFYIDTEKVTEDFTHSMQSGDLSIVDSDGRLVFWCYIKRANVCKFNTKLTGLNEAKMKMGPHIEMIKQLLLKLFTGKTLIGAAVDNDFISLGFDLKKLAWNKEDIQDFYKDSAERSISLAQLAEHFLGENTQGATHSSITDARLTAICDRKRQKFIAKGMSRFSCPVMDDLRMNPRNKTKKKGFDKCTCGKAEEDRRKKQQKSTQSLSDIKLKT